MQDYLQKVGKGWRIASAIACTLATMLFLLFFGILCAEARRQHGFHRDNVGLLAALLIMGLLAFFTFYLAWRLWQGSVSKNGATAMPTWFIQIFGICFLAGSAIVAFTGGSKSLFIESIFLAVAMIFVGRNIARRRSPRE